MQKNFLRLFLFLSLLGLLYGLASSAGLLDLITVDWIQNKVESAGPLGFFVYLVIFCIGVLVYIPGVVFIVAGLLGFGWTLGIPLALVGSILSGGLSVWVLQRLGGKALQDVQQPWIKRFVDQLHRQPIRSVAILRAILWISPPINTTLALSGIQPKENLVGTSIGMLGPVLVTAASLETVMKYFNL